MSARGIPVFNAPGANANAVKELVVAGMLLAARNIDHALKYLDSLDPEDRSWRTRSRPPRRRSTDLSWRIIRSALSDSARSVAWLPMRRSSSACM